MSTLTKVFIVLTSVLSIALSCLFIAAASQWNNWRALASAYQTQRDAAISQQQSEIATAQAALALKNEELAARMRELSESRRMQQSAQEELARVKSELAQTRNERLAFEAGRTKLQEILDVTTGELKTMQSQHQTLLDQNIDLQTRNSRLNSRVLELTTNITILNDQVSNLQEKLYAAEQVQRGPVARLAPDPVPGVVAARPAVAGEIRGRVREVTGNYASIDVGESSGVMVGMTFMVYRGNEYLGELVIERVRPGEAGGRLITLVEGQVRAGDSVSNAID